MELTDVNNSRIGAGQSLASLAVQQAMLAVASFRVANTSDRQPTEFGVYLLQAMVEAGITSRRSLARLAGVSNSTITRLINGEGEPDRPTLRKLAAALDLDYSDLLARAGHGRPGSETPQVTLHALAVEIDLLLGSSSPLAEGDRRYIADMTERLIAPYRKYLRRRSSA